MVKLIMTLGHAQHSDDETATPTLSCPSSNLNEDVRLPLLQLFTHQVESHAIYANPDAGAARRRYTNLFIYSKPPDFRHQPQEVCESRGAS